LNRAVIRTVARRESVELLRDGRFRWAAGLLLGILIASLSASIHRATALRHVRETAQREERERWLNKGKMLPHPAMHFGIYVYQPYLDLAAVDDGIEPYLGAYSLIEAHEQKVFQDRPVADEVPTRRFTDLTPALCLQLLVPLLVIALGFSAFVGERERGTWRQVLSTGVSTRDVGIGKAVGVLMPLFVLLVPAATLGSLALVLSASSSPIDLVARLVVMAGAYLAFFFVYVGLTLAVSLVTATARQALVILVTFWFVTSLMLPFVAIDVARRAYPSPTSFEFAANVLKAKRAEHYPTASEIQAELLATYRVQSLDDLPVEPTGIHLLRQMTIDDRIYNAALGRLHDGYRRQDMVLQLAGIASPLLALQAASMALCGTD
jgi:ABC-2 type transport system permease protein